MQRSRQSRRYGVRDPREAGSPRNGGRVRRAPPSVVTLAWTRAAPLTRPRSKRIALTPRGEQAAYTIRDAVAHCRTRLGEATRPPAIDAAPRPPARAQP